MAIIVETAGVVERKCQEKKQQRSHVILVFRIQSWCGGCGWGGDISFNRELMYPQPFSSPSHSKEDDMFTWCHGSCPKYMAVWNRRPWAPHKRTFWICALKRKILMDVKTKLVSIFFPYRCFQYQEECKLKSVQAFSSVFLLCNGHHLKQAPGGDANWKEMPPPPPDNPVTFSRQMRAGLVIGLWDSTLPMLSQAFHPGPTSLPPNSSPPLSVMLKGSLAPSHCNSSMHFSPSPPQQQDDC